MIRSMFAAVAALRNHQTFMDTVANNIANVNTTGFKAGRVDFQDALNQTIRGAQAPTASKGGINAVQVGLGMNISAIDNVQTQGNLQPTGKVTDMAIQGDGFFQMADGIGGIAYTRDGTFDVGSDGKLLSPATGFRVQGWQADDTGAVDTGQPIQDITIPFDRLSAAHQTDNVYVTGNLDARAATGTPIETVMQVFDSLGTAHNISIRFAKVAGSNSWDWDASTTDPDITTGNPIASGTLSFDQAGQPQVNPGQPQGALNLTFANGAANQSINLYLKDMTGYSQQSSANVKEQDGHAAGSLTSFNVTPDGTINGVFSNGYNQVMAQISLARFTNPGGMTRAGNNMFLASANSGMPIIGTPASQGFGTVNSGNLEMSNTDLAQQFTDMIRAQRGFQANSRMVTTSDEMLQELMQMKR